MNKTEIRAAKKANPEKIVFYDSFFKSYSLIDSPVKEVADKILQLKKAVDIYLEDNEVCIERHQREELIAEAGRNNPKSIENENWKLSIMQEFAIRKATLEAGGDVSLDFSSFGTEPNDIIDIIMNKGA